MIEQFGSAELTLAIEAVREAGSLVRQIQRELAGEALKKNDRSPVTVADFAAQALVARRLADAYPDQVLVGEEDAAQLRTRKGKKTLQQVTRFVRGVLEDAEPEAVCDWIDRGAGESPSSFWTLDPVDGTKGFLRGDQYAVALAYVQDGVVHIGALACPELVDAASPEKGGVGSIIVARRGYGCWTCPMQGGGAWQQLRVSNRRQIADARLLRSVEKAHTDAGGIGELVSALDITADPAPMDSQAKYAVLAAGGGEALVRLLSPSRPDYREKIWDQAAGSIVVEEAGGRVTDLSGKPLDFSQGRTLEANRGVLATNGHLHDAMLSGLKQIGA